MVIGSSSLKRRSCKGRTKSAHERRETEARDHASTSSSARGEASKLKKRRRTVHQESLINFQLRIVEPGAY
ncbi:hypothetical protein L596_018985 [Steinernema carpocapsae]|uniref:Uncharacterized protein n=1 Tax=Steinernema carpocapsae TaxID=34508 RepID=A0A4U5N6A3_STECR|nr:hypothetical protein L596_018985 [Steinernema carpocapsae]